MMGFNNFLVALCLMGLTMVPISLAQSSPNDYVAAHNKVRAAVGVGPVSWSAILAAYAQKQVNSRIDTCALVDSKGPYSWNS